MKVNEKIVMIRIRLANDQSIHRLNRVIIVVNVIVAIHRQVTENTKNHENVAQAAAVIVVATHVIRIVHENIQDENVHRPMIV